MFLFLTERNGSERLKGSLTDPKICEQHEPLLDTVQLWLLLPRVYSFLSEKELFFQRKRGGGGGGVGGGGAVKLALNYYY